MESFTLIFRNSWQSLRHFWQHWWNSLLDFTGDDEFNLYVWWTTLYTFMIYWNFAMVFTVMDLTNKPKFLKRYKIQPNTNEPVETKKLIKVIISVIFNQTFVGIPTMIIFYYAMKLRGIPNVRQLPSFHMMIFQIFVFVLVEEIAFYYSHRLMHKVWYKHIHKQHHLWQSPIAASALYTHPIEHILSNLFPPLLGVVICQAHIATAWLWFTIALLTSLNAHCGFHFPFFPSPEAHNYHHLNFNCNYGAIGLLDRLHGTDKSFRNSIQGKRHILLLSFISAHEIHPTIEVPKEIV